jgi:hypothetical protein
MAGSYFKPKHEKNVKRYFGIYKKKKDIFTLNLTFLKEQVDEK